RGVDGAFGKVMENYLLLKSLSAKYSNFNLSFNFTVQKDNIAQGHAIRMLEIAEGSLLPISFSLATGSGFFNNETSRNVWDATQNLHDETVSFFRQAMNKSRSGQLVSDNYFYYKMLLEMLCGNKRKFSCLF